MTNDVDIYEVEKSVRTIQARAAGVVSVNPKTFNEPMSFQTFFTLVAGCIALKGNAIEDVYTSLPHDVHVRLPLKVAKRTYADFINKQEIEGNVDQRVSSAVLQALYFGKYDPLRIDLSAEEEAKTEVEDTVPQVMAIDEFRAKYIAFKDRKGVAFPTIWDLLSTDTQAKYPFKSVQNYAFLCRSSPDVPIALANEVWDIYQKFTDWDQEVSSDEIFHPFAFERQLKSTVSARVSQGQINVAMKERGMNGKNKRREFVAKFAETVGVDMVEARKLLLVPVPSNKEVYTSRLHAAIVLAVIEDKPVPQATVDLYRRHAKIEPTENALAICPVELQISKVCQALNEVFKRINASPKTMYCAIPSVSKNSVPFNDLSRGSYGSFEVKQDVHTADFLKKVILLPEQSCSPA